MSDTVKANVYARCPLGGLPRFLLVTLADECDDDGMIQLNHDRVRTKLGVDQRTLTRMIARCEAEAGLVYAPGNGRGNKSTYILAAYTTEPVKVDKVDGNGPLYEPTKVDKVDANVPLSAPLAPPMVPPLVSPTPPSDPPPLSPPTPRSRKRPAPAPSGAPAETFSSIVLASIEASIGGASLKIPGGKLKPGIGQTIGLLGEWTGDDAPAAVALWGRFAASKEWQFKGHTSNWPIAIGDWRTKTGGASRPGSASRTPSTPIVMATAEERAAARAEMDRLRSRRAELNAAAASGGRA